MTEDLGLQSFSKRGIKDYRFNFSVANGYKTLPRPANVVAGIIASVLVVAQINYIVYDRLSNFV